MDPIPSFLRESYLRGDISKENFDRLVVKLGFSQSAEGESSSLKGRNIEVVGAEHVVSDEVRSILSIEQAEVSQLKEIKQFWKMKTVLFGASQGSSISYGLTRIGEKEGFVARPHPIDGDWVRDSSFPVTSEQWVLPKLISSLKISEAKSKCHFPGKLAKWDHLGFIGASVEESTHKRYLILQEMGISQLQIQQSDLYFEGGNILKAENLDGERCYLIGAYNVAASEEITTNVKEKFSELLPGKAVFIGLKKLEQLAFHLDVYLLPIMGGKVFVQDYEESIKLLEQLIAHPEVSKEAKKQFSLYLKDAQKIAPLQKNALKRLKEELKQNGFEPISISGNYHIEGKGKINFLNALYGCGECNHSFVATLGYGTAGETYLKGYYTTLLQKHGVEHVYYLPTTTASELLALGGGLHCRTLELPLAINF